MNATVERFIVCIMVAFVPAMIMSIITIVLLAFAGLIQSFTIIDWLLIFSLFFVVITTVLCYYSKPVEEMRIEV